MMSKSLEEIAGDLMDMDLRDYNFNDLSIFGDAQPATATMSLDELRSFLAEKREQRKPEHGQMGRRTWNG